MKLISHFSLAKIDPAHKDKGAGADTWLTDPVRMAVYCLQQPQQNGTQPLALDK